MFITILKVSAIGLLFSSIQPCFGGTIGQIEIESVRYNIKFEGEGSLPPVNKMLKLIVERVAPVSKLEIDKGTKNRQKTSVEDAATTGSAIVIEDKPENNENKLNLPTLTAFDAQMPEHGHGMFVKPKIKGSASNKYEIDGVKLHMRGRWELVFEWKKGSKTILKRVNLVL